MTAHVITETTWLIVRDLLAPAAVIAGLWLRATRRGWTW